MSDNRSILWLTPNVPESVSVGRTRIAEHLREGGMEVALRAANLQNFRKIASDLSDCDVVIGTTRAGAILSTFLCSLARIPFIIDHIDPIRQFKQANPRWLSEAVRIGENLSFCLSDHILYVYDEEYDRISSRATRLTQTSLGIEYELFAEHSTEAVESAESTLESRNIDDHLVVYVGGLEPIYHLKELLNAVSLLDGWTLIIIGAGSLESLVETAASHRSDVEFLGTVPHENVSGYLHFADVGACLVDDPHTLKALEYGASGVPVVQLDGRARKRYGEMVTYSSTSPTAIAEAIENASGSSPVKLKNYASQYDWSEIAYTYARVIKEVS